MPRSGTSWVGQIFDSAPSVAFRMEPLFSYQFKNIISESSSKEEVAKFFSKVYLSDDDFIHQKENRSKGSYFSFEKNENPELLVVKTTRHHELLERYLTLIDSIEVVSIVRHPCAVINSWINTKREFTAKGCTVENDWRSGSCRKDGVGEFWGFDDWLSVTHQHQALCQKYTNFNIVKYADLVHGLEDVTSKLFTQLSIPYTNQTIVFLKNCHNMHHDDPYSVYKSTDVENKWKDELDETIVKEIIKETVESGLGDYLV